MPERTSTASRYLVTGCAGFIAARVAQLLLADGHEVVGIDNLNDASTHGLNSGVWRNYKRNPRFHFHLANIASAEAVESIFARLLATGPAISAMVNLAARAGVRASVE